MEILREYVLPWGFFILLVIIVGWVFPRSGGG